MSLKNIIDQIDGIGYSLEFFPPKTDETLNRLKKILRDLDTTVILKPVFIDVTCSAGGAYVGFPVMEPTWSLCQWIQEELHIPACAHMIVRGQSRDQVISNLNQTVARGINHIMALRGDCQLNTGTDMGVSEVRTDMGVSEVRTDMGVSEVRTDMGVSEVRTQCVRPVSFPYASDLVQLIRQQYGDTNSVLVASYPEGHPDAHGNLDLDLTYLRNKLACGADITITQFFLDAQVFLNFRQKLGLTHVRVIPGIILPVTEAGLQRMITLAGGAITIPPCIQAEINSLNTEDKNAFREWGLSFTCRLCQELYQAGERFFHIYTLNANETVVRLIQFLGGL